MNLEQLNEYGQLQKGDNILIVWKCGKITCKKVKEVLFEGTKNEEIIYNSKKNYYFITDMVTGVSTSNIATVHKITLTKAQNQPTAAQGEG